MLIFCVVDSIEEVEKNTPYILFDEELHTNFRFMKQYGKLEKDLYVLADLDEYADTKIENIELRKLLNGIEKMQKEELLPTVEMFLCRLERFARQAIAMDKSLMAIGD